MLNIKKIKSNEWIKAYQFHQANAKFDKSTYDLELYLYSKVLKSDMLHYGYFENIDIAAEDISLKAIEDGPARRPARRRRRLPRRARRGHGRAPGRTRRARRPPSTIRRRACRTRPSSFSRSCTSRPRPQASRSSCSSCVSLWTAYGARARAVVAEAGAAVPKVVVVEGPQVTMMVFVVRRRCCLFDKL